MRKYYTYFTAVILVIFTVCVSWFILDGAGLYASDDKEKIVVIDAGHGGLDGGAVSKAGIPEKDINLGIALKLKSKLENDRVRVILTRDSDISLHNANDDSIRDKKRSDLKKRKEIADNSHADFLISIHLNSFGEEKYKGAQMFYERNHAESKILAEHLQKSIIENVDKTNTRTAKQIDSKKLLFDNIKIPAIIAECGFLSNAEEAEKLATEEYQEKIAKALYLGITDYYEREK